MFMKKFTLLSVAYALLIFIMSSMPSPPGAGVLPYNSSHFLLYFPFGALLYLAFRELRFDKKKAILYAISTALVYAATDELHQMFVPGRDADVIDWFIDSFGSVVGVMVIKSRSK